MKFAIRWKKRLLAVAAIATALVVLWGAFVFATMWLRIRCVRELARQARNLNEVGLYEHLNPESVEPAVSELYGNIAFWDLNSGTHGSDVLARLEELQHPDIRSVLRNLFGQWSNHDDTAQIDLIPSIAFSSINSVQGIEVTDEQTSESSAPVSIAFTVAQPAINVTTSASRFLISLWNSPPAVGVYSVTDTSGESVIVVMHTVSAVGNENEEPQQHPIRELLIIDSAGQILDRSFVRAGDIIGKLAKSDGVADQVVFGTPGYISTQNGTIHLKAVGPGTVRIIDHGKWKIVRTIEPQDSVGSDTQSEQSSVEN
jgi:hypothetical protein